MLDIGTIDLYKDKMSRCAKPLNLLALMLQADNPTLVIAGRQDASTPLKDAELIASQIPGATLSVLEAAHISNVEQSEAFSAAILAFLKQ